MVLIEQHEYDLSGIGGRIISTNRVLVPNMFFARLYLRRRGFSKDDEFGLNFTKVKFRFL